MDIASKPEHQDSSALLRAVERNDRARVEQLVQVSGVDVDDRDESGITALKLACRKGYTDIVQSLLLAGAKASLSDHSLSSPLHSAVEGQFDKIVQLLTEQSDADIFSADEQAQSPVSLAFHGGGRQVLITLLETEMNKVMSGTDGTGRRHSKSSIREFHSRLFETTMQIFKRVPNVYEDDTFRVLLDYLRRSLNAVARKAASNSPTVLHSAAFIGSAEALKMLMESALVSGLLNEVDEDDQTALHYAAMEGNLEAVRVLAGQNTARPCAADRFDRTAHQIALEKNWRDIAFHLLTHPDVREDQESLYRSKEALISAADALLVGGTLVSSVTFASVLQPPLGWGADPKPFVQLDHSPLQGFWVFNGLAFFTALLTVMCGTWTVVPERVVYIRDEVRMIRTRLRVTALTFFIAGDLLLVAYALAALAVLDPDGTHRYYSAVLITMGVSVNALCIFLFLYFSSRKRATRKLHRRPTLEWEDQNPLCDYRWTRNLQLTSFGKTGIQHHNLST